jgi:radical SAM superfamily enzyme YgiQ (UPF0313 family)
MGTETPEDYTIEGGPMGPIGEGQALILRINRNCPWNKCLFCPVYKSRRFSPRSTEEIKREIDAIRRIRDLIETTSFGSGLNEGVTGESIRRTVMSHPEIYGEYPSHKSRSHWSAIRSLNNVANWLLNGGRRVFLQDANALAMKPGGLLEVLRYLKETFPGTETITCYARSRTFARRSFQELGELKGAGLSWCFVGIESGCDQILEYMKKGVTGKEHMEGCQKAMASGLKVAAFVIPGLCGGNEALSRKHISDTIKVLNEVQATEIRVRSLAVLESAPLYQRYSSGEFEPATEDRLIDEIEMLVEGLNYDCSFETLQMTNPLFTVHGKLSEVRDAIRETIREYREMIPIERANILLNRYIHQGYLDCVKAWGKYDSDLKDLIADAQSSLKKGADNATEKTERAIFAIKSKGVP